MTPPRAVAMDTYPKSILKQGAADTNSGDDSYLFCNVPEHHDLEDYIVELQQTIKKLNLRIDREINVHEGSKIREERKTVKKLLTDLEERREELEGLDLAIERQKKNLRDMMLEEKDLRRERKQAHGELNTLRKKNDKKLYVRRIHLENERYDEEIERSRVKYLMDELKCMERTLAKRHAQLKETERNLKECSAELKDKKDQTRDTMKRYDEVTSKVHQAIKEQQEIEKRSNDAALELVKATEQLGYLKGDVKNLERKKTSQEKLLREINNIISKKDGEFKDLDAKVKTVADNLQRLQSDLVISSERERDMVQRLRDSEDVLAKRKSDIQKLRDQQLRISSATAQKVEQSKQELEKLDQQIGRKKTDLHLLQETHEQKQQQFTTVLTEAETDITTKHRLIKDSRDDLDSLLHQKTDLNSHLKTKKSELQQIKEDIEQEEEVLQRLINSVTKSKAELKHTLEMQRIELTELENIKTQQAQKLSELEKTQRALQEERSELEQMNTEFSRKSADLERLRQAVERNRTEVDELTNDKQNLDDQISVLTRDKDLLNENCKNLDEKLISMKRNQKSFEEKMAVTSSRLEMVESELRLKERELEESESQREFMQKEVQALKMSIMELKQEYKTLQENVAESEDQLKIIDKDARQTFHLRDEAQQELEHLNKQLHQSSITLDEHIHQERSKYKELQDLLRTLADREREHQETCVILNKLKNEVENESNRLKKIVNNANAELQMAKDELNAKKEELDILKLEFSELQKTTIDLQLNKDKCLELTKTCQSLEDDLKSKTKENSKLSNELDATVETLQQLQEENSEIKETLAKERTHFENTLKDLQENLDETKQEVKQVEKRSSNQVSKLQTMAEKYFNQANILETELSKTKKEVVSTKQKPDNKENVTVTELIIVPNNSLPTITCTVENPWTKDPLRQRVTEEQEYLRFQLKQQMLRHSETMESARIKSEETIECLRKKLNALQQVLFTTNPERRSRSPGYRPDAVYKKSLNVSKKPSLTDRQSKSSENLSYLENGYH